MRLLQCIVMTSHILQTADNNVSGILKKSTSSAFEGLEDEDCCNSQCSCSDSGSCSCSDDEQPVLQPPIPSSANQDTEQEIPPPLEFDTNMLHGKGRFQTNVKVEVNPCHEISPTESEDMKYCATEVDQFYKPFTPQYTKPTPGSTHIQQHGSADSATDSAIDMPGDGSVSTINDIPPHHSTALLSSTHKHTPTVADYSDMQFNSEVIAGDGRTRMFRTPRHSKPLPPRSGPQETKLTNTDSHPVIYEYSKPPTNRSLADNSDSIKLETFKLTNHGKEPHRTNIHSRNASSHDSSRLSDESVAV